MDAVQTMAYQGQTPWHGKGNVVTPGSSIETWLTESGLDWEVRLANVMFQYQQDGKKKQVTDPSNRVLFRPDNGQVFDVVGKVYQPVQNSEVLEFFREYVEAGDMEIETAGALHDGRQIWALAKMNESFNLGTKDSPDKVGGYVLLMNPHQYGKGMVAKFTGTRVVCHNTIQVALKDGGESVKLWHNRKFDATVREEAKRRLGIARDQMTALQRDAEKLVELKLTPEQVIEVSVAVFGGDVKAGYDEQPRRTKRIVDLYNGEGIGARLDTAKGTGWGLLNAVTQYIDHEYGRSQDARLEYAWLGGGETVKRKARVELLALTSK